MTYDKTLFSSYSSGSNSSVELANSNVANVSGSGTVDIARLVKNKPTRCRLSNVLHVPDLGYQLLSVSTLDKSGLKISFLSGRCEIMRNESLLATGSMIGNLYRLDSVFSINNQALVTKNMGLWHRRLAHIYPTVISDMSTKNIVTGIDQITRTQHYQSSHCPTGKVHRNQFRRSLHLVYLISWSSYIPTSENLWKYRH